MSSVRVVEAEVPPSANEVASALDESEGVVLVGSWAPGEWSRLRAELRRAGARWHLAVYVDRERDALQSGLGVEGLVESYKAYLAEASRSIPVVVSEVGKVVSRRDLLKAGLGIFFTYTAMPEVLEGKCSSLKVCNICAAQCPRGALRGKPPGVAEGLCIECGLCASYCPSGLLRVPAFPPEAVRRLLYELKSRGASRVVVACPESREWLYKAQGSAGGAVLELPCIAALRVHEYLFARALGLDVAFTCPWELRSSCERGRAAEEYLELIGEAKVVAAKPGSPTASELLPVLASAVAEPAGGWAPLSKLALFRVEVDGSLCTLCGACARACPTGSLLLAGDGEYKLKFNHSRCIGCGACVAVCPEKAVRVERAANTLLLSTGASVDVAAGGVAKCRRCGAPIGPEAGIRRLEEKLRRAGAGELQLDRLWLCSKCKQEALVEELASQLE